MCFSPLYNTVRAFRTQDAKSTTFVAHDGFFSRSHTSIAVKPYGRGNWRMSRSANVVIFEKESTDSLDFSPVIMFEPRDYVKPHVTSGRGNSSWHL